MRKRLISPIPLHPPLPDHDWFDVERVAQVEVSSEEVTHPIESALLPGEPSGWRAAQPGRQTIRLVFDQPQRLRRIRLLFIEADIARTQEFTLRWSPDAGRSYREIVRQQWNFSPVAATREVEDYQVELSGVTILELTIVPDQGEGDARASLAEWRVA